MSIQIVYDSFTGQTEHFAKKLDKNAQSVQSCQIKPDDKVILCTRSFRFGEIPEPTQAFLTRYAKQVIGCCVSGNKNWGSLYGAAGEQIEKDYGIPLICKFEASGTPRDSVLVKQFIEKERSKI